MADNVTFQNGTLATPASGTVVATKDIGGKQYQEIVIALTDGTTINALLDAGQQLSAASLPVVLASDHSDIAITLDGETVTITGSITGTVDLGATDNAVLDAIAASLAGTLTVDGSGVTQPVSAASLPLPSGASTAANQSTGNTALSAIQTAVEGTLTVDASGAAVPVTDNGGSLTVDNGGTFATQLDGAGSQSVLGVNSSNEISNSSYSNWSTNTWTGAGEQNDYQHVGVSLQVDEAGTLFFDFSPDGTNWNTFPPAGFSVAPGTHEKHTAVKESRYFRPRFVGSGGRSYFRLYTYYSNTPLQLNSPLNLSMSGDTDAIVIKSAHVVQYYPEPSTVAEGDFDTPSLTRHREIRTRDQRHVHFQECEDFTDFTALGNDTLNLANSSNHIYGQYALTFDKVNGAANTVFAGVSTTTLDAGSTNIDEIFEEGGFVTAGVYLPSIADVDYVFVRYGTDGSNYNEWRWDVADLTAASWLNLRKSVASPDSFSGNGWLTTNVPYLAFGVAFNAETDTLAGIIFDNVGFVAGRVTDTTLNATVTSSVTTPNINLHRVGGIPTDANTGNASAGTQRVVLATDQPSVTVDDGGSSLTIDGTVTETNSTAILADTANIDTNIGTIAGAVSGTEMQVDVVTSALPSGAATAANQSTVIGHVDGIETLLGTIDSDTSTLAGAVSGSEMQVDVVGSLPAGTNTIGAVNAKPTTSGGLTIFRSIDLDESEEEIKASAGQVYGWYMFNAAASTRYVKFYNATAASVTVGTTTPVLTIPIPAGSGANVEFTNGIAFSTAITAAATTGVADADTGAPSANDVVVNIFYA